jgi:Mce-associated membrane protein
MNIEQDSQIDTAGTPDDATETSPAGKTDAPLASEESTRATGPAMIRRWTRRYLARWRWIVSVALVVATMGVAVGLFFLQYQPDRRIDDTATHRATQAASDGTVALLSYSYESLDRDFATAKSHLTGDFLAYYRKFSEQIAAGAQQGQLTATAKVIRAAVSDLRPDSAVVLVFVDQTTASKQKPEPVKAASSILVTLTKVNGSWLVAKFDPVG